MAAAGGLPDEPPGIAAGQAVQAARDSASQWQVWQATGHVLLDTPEKAIAMAEAVIAAAYGTEQLAEERPLVAEDRGPSWAVHGTGAGSHALPFFRVSSMIILEKRRGTIEDYRLSTSP